MSDIEDLRPWDGKAYCDEEVSPTQIGTWRECQRKWAWKRIGKIDVGQKASAALGTRTHKQLEHYLAGQSVDFMDETGEILAPAVEHFPAPGLPGMKSEWEFRLEAPKAGVILHGLMDIWVPPTPEDPWANIFDLKTTSDINRWAKTPEDLQTDPQGVIYAGVGMAYGTTDRVNLNWVYTQTRGTKKSKKVHLPVIAGEGVFRENWKNNLDTAQEIVRNYKRDKRERGSPACKPGDEVSKIIVTRYQPNPAACDGFGGCPYREFCPDVDPFSGLFGENKEDMSQANIDDLIKGLGAQHPTGGAPVQINPPERSPEPNADPMAALRAKVASGNSVQLSPAEIALLLGQPPPAAPTVTATTPIPTSLPSLSEVLPAPRASQAVAAAVGGGVSPPAEKPKRGRPKKETALSEISTPIIPASEEAEAVVSGMLASSKAAQVTSADPIGCLYVNCAPLGEACASLGDILPDLADGIRAKHGKADYRFFEYGQGPGHLSEELKSYLEGKSIPALAVDTRTPEGAILLYALFQASARVVQAR
jgi:hypothetical protein